ncbi:hypothetical protein ES708_32843 [subsurface metagenome]
MEWDMVKEAWLKILPGKKRMLTELNGWLKGIKIILPLSSGLWEMKREMELILPPVTNGSMSGMNQDRFITKAQDWVPILIFTARCMPVSNALRNMQAKNRKGH